MIKALLLTAVLAAPALAADVQVSGIVVDAQGQPVEYATVNAPALKRGVATDGQGRFTLMVPEGACTLVAQQVGYVRATAAFNAAAGVSLKLVLGDQPVPLEEVTVRTSSFGKQGGSDGAVISRMDVYTTPGGAADVFQSLRALPGIDAPNEGAAIYVRGGDPSETLVRMDGSDIGHPYHYEGASGGLFANFDSYMLKSAFFSSGGFSAKYGGVLSGVLDIETQDPLNTKTVGVGANFAGAHASASWALVPDKLSVVGAGGLSTTTLLHALYGTSRTYQHDPTSDQGALKAIWRHSPKGRVTATYLGSGDHVAVESPQYNYDGVYESKAGNHFAVLQADQLVGTRLSLAGVASYQDWATRWTYGAFGGDVEERAAIAQGDGLWSLSPAHQLSFGARVAHGTSDRTSLSPADSTDYAEGAPTRAFETRARTVAPGAYLEDKFHVAGPVYATVGARTDRLLGIWTFDPRAALAYRLSAHHTLRVAGGRYHQSAGAQYLDPVYGNPDLGPLEADHLIAGWEWLDGDRNARVEAYRKNYRDLVTNDSTSYYANTGYGYAQGVDVFVKASHRDLAGWVSYGYLDARRKELDDPRQVPASYGVPHTATVVASYRVAPAWTVGTRISASSGAPYTPVVGRLYDPARGAWRPVEGENNSGRMPVFSRVDVRATYLFSLPAMGGIKASSVCVAYIEALNVLNRHNTLRYTWNEDYTERHAEDSYFGRRLVVAGVGLAW